MAKHKSTFLLGLLTLMLVAHSLRAIAADLPPDAIYNRVSGSVVSVSVLGPDNEVVSSGSGVVVSQGIVVSNCHVLQVAGGESIRVIWLGQVHRARIENSDRKRDVCSVSVEGLRARPVQVGSSVGMPIGSRVYAVGSPQGFDLTLSDGLLSGFRTVGDLELLQTTAPISHGSSGGGLFNSNAQLIGITTLFSPKGQALNFAVPVEWIQDLLGHARADQEVVTVTADTAAAAAVDAAAAADAVAATAATSEVRLSSKWSTSRDAENVRWISVYADDEAEIFFDTETVKTNAARPLVESDWHVIVWVKTVYLESRSNGATHEVRRNYYWCNRRESSGGAVREYDIEGRVVHSSDGEPNALRSIVPGTVREHMFELACESFFP